MSHLTASPLLRVLVVVILLVLVAVLAACQAERKAPTAETAGEPATTSAAALSTAEQAATVDSTTPTQPSSAAAQPDYWPTKDWRVADAAAHRVDTNRLNAMMDYIKLKGLDILGVVVVRDGYVVFEQYGRNLGPQSRGEVYSVTKSFASTLVGIAQRKGLLTNLDEQVLTLLAGAYENMDSRKQAMTLEDVLTMRSGLTWTDDDATLGAFYSASDPVKFMLNRPMAADPGTEFNYCSGCSHLLTTLVSKATGMNAGDFAQAELLGPLGITGAFWTRDRNGTPLGGWGLSLTTREMAKLGFLFLNRGTWDGAEIVTPGWVETATKKHTTTDSANGYGYQWWTHPKFPAYMALGRFGQIVYVNPEKDLVLAMRAQVANHDPIYYLIETYVEPAVK